MAKKLTEDAVRDKARDILGFKDKDGVRSGVGQLTTFNQLGFAGVADKPDGWYLPDNHAETALVLETKASYISLGDKQVDEVLKNVKIVQEQYGNVVGILYNGDDTRVFKGEIEFQGNVCRFLATCLQTVVFKYPYNFGLFPELLKDERIMLPVDSNGEPNWTYMEVYMQKVLDEVETNIETMQNVKKEKSILDIKEWKKFVIGDLFEISRPIARSQTEYVEGNVPFVASGNYNNGIVKWCMPKEDESLDFGNCITVSPLDGSAFYQKENFLGRGGAGSAILMLRNAELTELSGLFIASVIRNALTKYS